MATLSYKSLFTYALSTLKSRWVKEVQTFYKPITVPDDLHKFAQEFAQSLPLDVMMAFNGRFERGEKMAKQGMVSLYKDPVRPDRKRLFRVRSSNSLSPPFSYIVDLDNQTCECPDHMKGHFCKHRVASHIIELAMQQTPKVAESVPVVPEPKAGNGKVEEDDQSQAKGESIIWAVIKHNGEILGVEVLNIAEDQATVRALPTIKDGKKLQPRFPFAGGKSSLDIVPKESLFHVKIFKHQ